MTEKASAPNPPIAPNNYAFIDGQNLNAGVESLGWKLDYKKFREYLRQELQVKKAYIFVGFMEEYQPLYSALQEAGFILHFKPLVRSDENTIKGNVDADMVLQTMVDVDRYDAAVIVSGDGDFAGLVRHLASVHKLRQVLVPNRSTHSSLFKRMADYGDTFTFLNDLRRQLAYRDFSKRRHNPNPRTGDQQGRSDSAPGLEHGSPKQ
jgi:uncharacterized LabA/DUF88 family protein